MKRFCMNCGLALPEAATFCPKCGAAFQAPVCPSCGKEVDLDQPTEFCMYCGASLREEARAAEAPVPASVPEPAPAARPEPVSAPTPEPAAAPTTEAVPEPTPAPEAPVSGAWATIRGERETAEKPRGGMENSRWLLESRHPNPTLLWLKFRYDVVMTEKELIEYDHRGDDVIPGDARRYAYEDFCFAEVERTASAFFLLTALALVLFAALGFVFMPVWRQGDVSAALAVAAIFGALFLARAFQVRVRATKWTGENVYFVSTGKIKMEAFCQELQQRIAQAQIGSPTVERAFDLPGDGYFKEQFIRIRRGETGSFNGAAFLFGGAYYYYRKNGRAFWSSFKWLYILPVVLIGGALALFGPALGLEDGFYAWLCGFFAVVLTVMVYALSCAVRAGRRFNREYYRCCLLAAAGPAPEAQRGTSAGGAVLFLLCAALVSALCGYGTMKTSPVGSLELWGRYTVLGEALPGSSSGAPASLPETPVEIEAPVEVTVSGGGSGGTAVDVPAAGKDYMDYTCDNWGYLSASDKEAICQANRGMDQWVGSVVSVYIVESVNGPMSADDVANMWWAEAGLRDTDALFFMDRSAGGDFTFYTGVNAVYEPEEFTGEFRLHDVAGLTLGEKIAAAIDGLAAGLTV